MCIKICPGNYYGIQLKSFIRTYGVATLVFDVIHLSPVPAAMRNAVKTQAGRNPEKNVKLVILTTKTKYINLRAD